MRVFVFTTCCLCLLIFTSAHKKRNVSKVKWYTFEEAVRLQKDNPKKILIDVYTDWCGWCKVMDKNTFNNPDIATYLNENYYPVKFNAEQKEDIVYKGRTFKFVTQSKRGYHELAAALLEYKLSFPSVVILDEEMKVLQRLNGYLKPDQFSPIIQYIGGNFYLEKSWQEYSEDFK